MPGIQAGDIVWKIEGDDSGFQRAIDKTSRSANQLKGKLGDISKKIGIGMTAAAAAIGGIGIATGKAAAEFGSNIANINTLGVKNLGAIEDAVKNTAKAFGQDLNVAAEAAYQAISAGASEAELPKVLESSARAAAAGMTDLSTSVELGLSTLNAFGGELKSTDEVFDLAFIAVKNGVTTFEELSASVGKVSPLFAAAGLGADEMFASVAALTKGGIATAEAVTGMKAAMTAIIKPTDQLNNLFEDMGGALSAAQELGLKGFLDEIKERTGGSVEAMGQLFGSVEALNAVLALTGTGAKDFGDILQQMQADGSATQEAFDKMVEANPAFAFGQLKSEIQVLSVEIGKAFLPVAKRVVDALRPIVSGITEWVSANPGLAASIGTVVAVIGAVMAVLGPLLIVLPGIVAAVGFIGPAFAAAAAAVGVAVGLISAPVLLVAGVIAGAVAGIIIYWDELKAAGEALWNALTVVWQAGVELITGLFDMWVNAQQMKWEAIKALFNAGVQAVSSVFTSLGDAIGAVWDWISGKFQAAADFIGGIVDRIVGFVQQAIDAVANLPGGGAIADFLGFARGGVIPKVQHLARGGSVSPVVVGERGPELAFLPAGTRVMSNTASKNAVRGAVGGGGNVMLGDVIIGNIGGGALDNPEQTTRMLMPHIERNLRARLEQAKRTR